MDQSIQEIKKIVQENNYEKIGKYLKQSTEELGKYVFTYGKQKDKSFEEVFKTDCGYCAWVINQRISKDNAQLYLFQVYCRRLVLSN